MKALRHITANRIPLLCRRRTWIRILAVLVVMLAILYLGFVYILPMDHDEVEHAHVGFKMLQGQIPYRDFYQNHLPAYWLLSMQLVRAYPFSINAILAGRAVNLLALAGCWALGLLLLNRIRGGRTWFSLSLYTCAFITLANEMQFHIARPDPIMALFATAGLCMIPARGRITGARALLAGLLFGLALALSIKATLVALVVPALVILHCIRARQMKPAATLVPYGLGVLLALLPTALWILRNGLFKAFYFDVFDLNNALAKPWHFSIGYLLIPVFLISILGALAELGICRRQLDRHANTPLAIALMLAAGLALAVLSRHPARYNLQVLVLPMALGFVCFILHLCLHIRIPVYQWLLVTALIGYPVIHMEDLLVKLKNRAESMPQGDLQALMDLAKSGVQTCTAFSPGHPIFCHDVSGLSNGWDLFFAESIRKPAQRDRFRRLWRDGIQQTIAQQPDLILRRSPDSNWERAIKAGLIDPEELHRLDALLHTAYIARQLGPREIWIRKIALKPAEP